MITTAWELMAGSEHVAHCPHVARWFPVGNLRAMKIAMIGLGSIARKAYLPVLSAVDGAELVFCTRDPETAA